MPDVDQVKTRLKGYLGRVTPDRARLRDTLDTVSERLPDTVIFGGMLRDFALGAARRFVSDIDLVAVASSGDIERALQDFSPSRNKFGGYRFASGKWRFDLWSFQDTWAFRQGLIQGSQLSDLLKTTFFNLDAAIYHLGNCDLVTSPDYNRGVLQRLLEINLESNPAPARMAHRAIRMALERDLSIGPRLATFILAYLPVPRIAGPYCSFISGLAHHVRTGSGSPYWFRPQASIEFAGSSKVVSSAKV